VALERNARKRHEAFMRGTLGARAKGPLKRKSGVGGTRGWSCHPRGHPVQNVIYSIIKSLTAKTGVLVAENVLISSPPFSTALLSPTLVLEPTSL
jgi:hypothetical protein